MTKYIKYLHNWDVVSTCFIFEAIYWIFINSVICSLRLNIVDLCNQELITTYNFYLKHVNSDEFNFLVCAV